MKMKTAILLSLAILLAACGTLYLRRAMPAAEVIRKLSGLRMAMELYRQDHKGFPADYTRVLEAGNLEAVPDLKLKWRLKTTKVRTVNTFKIANTGGWAYVGNPSDPQFGLVYIDSSSKDEKGRPWSEF